MTDLFFYGSLRDAELRRAILGHDAQCEDVVLTGAVAFCVKGETYPALVLDQSGQAVGVLARGLSATDVDRLNYFEDIGEYHLAKITVETASGPAEAEAYLPNDISTVSDKPWDFANWQNLHRKTYIEVARELMNYYGLRKGSEVRPLWLGMRIRALARAAADGVVRPNAIGCGWGRDRVEVAAKKHIYADYFGIEDYRLSHPVLEGGQTPMISRAILVSGDAVTVLPYDPIRREVVLVEQFRMGPFARGDFRPWQLEPIAGRCDAAETPEATARREALEEAGLTLGRLEHLSSYYPSPGTVTEYMHSFVGEADLSGYATGHFGLEEEAEDIRSHVVGLDTALTAVTSGEISVGPLVMSLFWLQANAERLATDWGAAG